MTATTQPDLWAKSARTDASGRLSVFEHCSDVCQVAQATWDILEKPLADVVHVQVEILRQRTRPLLFASAMLHDVLKANSAFQDMLENSCAKWVPTARAVAERQVERSRPVFVGTSLRGADI